MEVQYVDEQDIRDIVESDCRFDIEDCGIGYYEHGNGKYKDISMRLCLTSGKIMVQYPIDTDSAIFTMVTGTYYLCGGYTDYECDYIAELDYIEYNKKTKMFEAHYEVNQG